MKKKITGLALAGFSVLMLSGCGDDTVYVDPGPGPGPEPITLFLLDDGGFSYAGIPYLCDGMIDWKYTLPNGEFTFFEFNSCRFDFAGLAGNIINDPFVDDIIRVTDDVGVGVMGIAYDCTSYGPGTTRVDGDFSYAPNDMCTFHFEGVY